ncbi:hypothetical protein QWZ13_12675 [Reinekea marina]|uniref:hypothetical protein n=1 Tax=Reinekea marina TaxID=1310421 RepID=UPI0025B59AFA|nr:hypothetical protein [Reinekea marina]MDN3649767.1 hypothetical protein [Reinekea marina]
MREQRPAEVESAANANSGSVISTKDKLKIIASQLCLNHLYGPVRCCKPLILH